MGFDNTQPNNTAASFTYNAYAYAPNNSLGSFEWSQPFSGIFQIDRLNWGRSGTKVLLTKGATNGGYYQLYVYMASTNVANFCFEMVTKGGIAAPNQVIEYTCSPLPMDMPNGYNYTLQFGNDGTGQPNSTGIWLTVNGVNLGNRYYNPGGSYANGAVVITVGGSGTGYANSTPFNGIGGGANCTVFGKLNAASGVPSTVTISYTSNYGCTSLPTITLAPYNVTLGGSGTGYATSTAFTSTGGGTGCSIAGTMTSSGGVPASITITQDTNACTSAPTIVLTTPTGTGATLTAAATTGTGVTLTPAAFGATLVNASPLYILGYTNGTTVYSSTTNTADPPLILDEFALFSSQLSQTQIHANFYQTKFYQSLLNTLPSTPYRMIYDNDGCADADNLWALTTAIAAQRIGYIQLAGVVSTTSDGQSPAMYRQMLDQAGLAHIPVSVPSSFAISSNQCVAASLNTYNSSTTQSTGSYVSAASMYRKIMAANPTRPVFIMLGGSFRGVADWMQSSADGIEGLTGLQQLARNATNGGAIYAQGLELPPATYTGGDNSFQDAAAGQYVVANNGTMPIYFFGGVPQDSGPGPLYTRNSKDPMYLFSSHLGTDIRVAYDSLPTANFLSSLFSEPVNVTIGGSGTGYANITYFTSTGGGPNCVANGSFTSVSGVPTTVNSPGGTYSTYYGLGSGCTSAPTLTMVAPTGTGATLTATPLFACGTYTITSITTPYAGNATTTCGAHYFANPSTQAANSGSAAPVLEWFLNSLNDPPPNPSPRVR